MDQEIEQLLKSLDIAVPQEDPVQPRLPGRSATYIWTISVAVTSLCALLVWALWPTPKRISRFLEQPERSITHPVDGRHRYMWSTNDLLHQRKGHHSILLQYETATSLHERIEVLSEYQKKFTDLMAEHIMHPDQKRVYVLRRMLDQFLMADVVSAHKIVHALQQLSLQEQEREIAYQGLGHHIMEYDHQYAEIVRVKKELAHALQAIESVDTIIQLADCVQVIRRSQKIDMVPFLDTQELEKVPEAVLRAIRRLEKNFDKQTSPRSCSQEEREAIDKLIAFAPDAALWAYVDGARRAYAGPVSLTFHEKKFSSTPFVMSCVRLMYRPESSLTR